MMEQRHAVRGREQGPSDLIGMESQSWLIKTRAIVKHGIDCYLTQNSVFLGLGGMFFLGSPSWGSLVHRSTGTCLYKQRRYVKETAGRPARVGKTTVV